MGGRLVRLLFFDHIISVISGRMGCCFFFLGQRAESHESVCVCVFLFFLFFSFKFLQKMIRSDVLVASCTLQKLVCAHLETCSMLWDVGSDKATAP